MFGIFIEQNGIWYIFFSSIYTDFEELANSSPVDLENSFFPD